MPRHGLMQWGCFASFASDLLSPLEWQRKSPDCPGPWPPRATPPEGGPCTSQHFVPDHPWDPRLVFPLTLPLTVIWWWRLPTGYLPHLQSRTIFPFGPPVQSLPIRWFRVPSRPTLLKNDSSVRLYGSMAATPKCLSVGTEYRKEILQDLVCLLSTLIQYHTWYVRSQIKVSSTKNYSLSLRKGHIECAPPREVLRNSVGTSLFPERTGVASDSKGPEPYSSDIQGSRCLP